MSIVRKFAEKIRESQFFKGKVLFDEPMKTRTTMQVGGNAAALAVPETDEAAVYAAWSCIKEKVPLFVLGGGSNIVVSDSGIDSLVISLEKLDSIEYSDGILTCGAGAKFDKIEEFCAQNCISGLSEFAGLPGTAGGACYMNARCYGASVSDVIESAEYVNLSEIPLNSVFNLANLTKVYHNRTEDWDYKKSPFMDFCSLILSASFKVRQLEKSAETEARIRSLNEGYVEDRRNKGHFKAPSAGSVFRNNRLFGKPSGLLVDEAGLKGLAEGGAQIAPWHGNFIINNGGATAGDVKLLVQKAQEAVKVKTGFELVPEIIFV